MLLTVSLAVCAVDAAADPGDPGTEETPTSISDLIVPAPPQSTPIVVQPPETHMEAIRADLNKRGVAGAEATLVESRPVTWRTGGLGCPAPGTLETQALVDGWKIVVKVGDTLYDYHFGSDPSPKLCENNGLPFLIGGSSVDPWDI